VQASGKPDKPGHSPYLKHANGGDAQQSRSAKQIWTFERRTRQQGGYCTWSDSVYRIKHLPTNKYLRVGAKPTQSLLDKMAASAEALRKQTKKKFAGFGKKDASESEEEEDDSNGPTWYPCSLVADNAPGVKGHEMDFVVHQVRSDIISFDRTFFF